MLAPVIVFAYNRQKHIERTLEELSKNRLAQETNVYVFVDGPKKDIDIEKVKAVQKTVTEFGRKKLFKTVTVEFSEKNKGLANSIIGGVTKVIQKEKKVIVLEDDLLTAPDFLEYMNQGLDYYEKDCNVGAISAVSPALRKKIRIENGIYKSRTGNSCGWGTWEHIWKDVDWEVTDYNDFIGDVNKQKMFNQIQYGIADILKRKMDGEISSWAVCWDYYFWKKSLWTIYPIKSHISNIGFDGDGTTSNNLWDRRKKIVAFESKYEFKDFEELEDYTKFTADSFRPGLVEMMYDLLINIRVRILKKIQGQ